MSAPAPASTTSFKLVPRTPERPDMACTMRVKRVARTISSDSVSAVAATSAATASGSAVTSVPLSALASPASAWAKCFPVVRNQPSNSFDDSTAGESFVVEKATLWTLHNVHRIAIVDPPQCMLLSANPTQITHLWARYWPTRVSITLLPCRRLCPM